MLTVDGKLHGAGEKQAVIGTYGETDRQRITVRRLNGQVNGAGSWRQVNREGNSLINELIIGTGSKDLFSVSDPKDDGQFASYFLDPVLAHLYSSILHIPVPPAPRTDLLPLVQYMAPICPGCGPKDAGPVADLLRLNTGIPPTPVGSQKRLGFLAGDLGNVPLFLLIWVIALPIGIYSAVKRQHQRSWVWNDVPLRPSCSQRP